MSQQTEIEDLRFENEELKVKLRAALAAMEMVEWVRTEIFGRACLICPWCRGFSWLDGDKEHAEDCLYELVMGMAPVDIGERTEYFKKE